MLKSSKRFVLSNEKLNSEGFNIITGGIDLQYFKSKPQLYWMLDVKGAKTGSTAVKNSYWTDIQESNNEISAVPVFDDADTLAVKLFNKVEHGSIKSVNVVFEYIEFDTNIPIWKIGQRLPSVTKSRLTQASLSVGDEIEDVVTLYAASNIICIKSNNHANGVSFNTTLNMNNNLNQEPAKNKNGYQPTPGMQAILDNAIACGKCTKAEVDNLMAIADDNADVISAIKGIIKLKPIKPENIEGKYHQAIVKEAATKTYDQISNGGDVQLRSMKAIAPELYKAKFFEKYGRMPADVA
jgi:hypothetical protein